MKITIMSVNQFFLLGGAMTIFLNGVESAWIGLGEKATIDAPEGLNTVKVKSSLREKEITFEATKDVTITTKWNRFSGKIEALTVGEDVKLIK